MLMKVGKKNESEWLIKLHDTTNDFGEFQEKPGENLYFKYEPPIIHICCKTINDAQRLLTCAKDSGFKKSSIINIEPRIVIEILSSERVEAPFWDVSKDYLSCLITEANKKLLLGKEKLDRLHEKLKNETKNKN